MQTIINSLETGAVPCDVPSTQHSVWPTLSAAWEERKGGWEGGTERGWLGIDPLRWDAGPRPQPSGTEPSPLCACTESRTHSPATLAQYKQELVHKYDSTCPRAP